MQLRLNTILAKAENSGSRFRKRVTDYIRYFKGNQGDFTGVRKTYTPRPGMQDSPSDRQFKRIVTTVPEKLEWFVNESVEHLQSILDIDATNSSNTAKAPLIVDGVNFGELSALELLRLKSFLEKESLEELYNSLPVRSDSEQWDVSDDDSYKNRFVYQTRKMEGTTKTIRKTSYILPDPNIQHLGDDAKYTPQVAQKDDVLDVGDYSVQLFSGEATHTMRANILRRRSKLLEAVITSLQVANEAEVVKSNFDPRIMFNYLHNGTPNTE